MKYTIENSPVEKNKWLIKHCFDGDAELVEKFHVAAGSGLDSCVENTFTTLLYGTVGYEFYILKADGEAIGYFGKEVLEDKIYLTSFAITYEYRNDKSRKALWKFICQVLGKTFYCGLYLRNSRAIKFIENNGGVLQDSGEEAGEVFMTYLIKK